jgi:hypothetical protein
MLAEGRVGPVWRSNGLHRKITPCAPWI